MSYLDSYQKRGVFFQRHKLFYTTEGTVEGIYLSLDTVPYNKAEGLYITKDNITWKNSKLMLSTKESMIEAINTLDTNTGIPADAEYVILQYGYYGPGGTKLTGYARKPVSVLWDYIKSKLEVANTYAKTDMFYTQKYAESSGGHLLPAIYGYIGGSVKKAVLDTDTNGRLFLNAVYNENYAGIIITGEKLNNQYFGSVTPSHDNLIDLGSSGRRWKQIYATTSTIATSDRAAKKDIKDLNDDQTIAFVLGLKPKTFKLIDGESGRTHWGLLSNDIEKLLEDLGMSTLDFAGFIKSPKTKTVEKEIEQEVEKDGEIVIEKSTVLEEQIIEEEYIYGLRYEEFISPLIKAFQLLHGKVQKLWKKNSALEKKLSALEKENAELKEKVGNIESALEEIKNKLNM